MRFIVCASSSDFCCCSTRQTPDGFAAPISASSSSASPEPAGAGGGRSDGSIRAEWAGERKVKMGRALGTELVKKLVKRGPEWPKHNVAAMAGKEVIRFVKPPAPPDAYPPRWT